MSLDPQLLEILACPDTHHAPLTEAQKAAARKRAKKAGRPYPNLVDNMWAAQQRKTREDDTDKGD